MAKDPVREYLAEIGRKGGKVKTPKGFAAMSPEKRAEALKRSLKTRRANKKSAAKRAPARRVP